MRSVESSRLMSRSGARSRHAAVGATVRRASSFGDQRVLGRPDRLQEPCSGTDPINHSGARLRMGAAMARPIARSGVWVALGVPVRPHKRAGAGVPTSACSS